MLSCPTAIHLSNHFENRFNRFSFERGHTWHWYCCFLFASYVSLLYCGVSSADLIHGACVSCATHKYCVYFCSYHYRFHGACCKEEGNIENPFARVTTLTETCKSLSHVYVCLVYSLHSDITCVYATVPPECDHTRSSAGESVNSAPLNWDVRCNNSSVRKSQESATENSPNCAQPP